MEPIYIVVDGKEVNPTSRSVDTLYLVNLKEYINQTGVDVETLIKSLTLDIEMLEKSRQKYMKYYRDLPYLSNETEIVGNLLSDIVKTLQRKTAKLSKYKEVQ